MDLQRQRPTSRAEADKYLEQLRASYGAANTKKDDMLHSLIALNSKNLYKDPGHFLFELLQNADDNSYDDPKPRVSLKLMKHDGYKLTITSNELGFTFNDVDAISDITKSTKRINERGQRDSTGEKGIGFKSVFSVADVVEIRSGFFSFKFDCHQKLGMVVPQPLDTAPSSPCVRGSQILLHLKGVQEYNRVLKDLSALDPQVLLFFRKLKRIRISYNNQSADFRATQTSAGFATKKSISAKYDSASRDATLNFYCFQHVIKDVAEHETRSGIQKTAISLAFPVTKDGMPDTRGQKTYATLPIADFGWKFAINADFVLTASRETFEDELEWNKKLRNGVLDAALKALKTLAMEPSFSTSWYSWLLRHDSTSAFWKSLEDGLFLHLSNSKVLASQDDALGLAIPCGLLYIPEAFRFNEIFILRDKVSDRRHLAFDHDQPWSNSSTARVLKRLGVKEMTSEILVNELKEWLSFGSRRCLGNGKAWFEKLANILKDEHHLKTRLRTLPIVFLRDVTWVTANEPHLYLESNIRSNIPASFKARMAHPGVVKVPGVRELYQMLGLQPLQTEHVCRQVLDIHESLTTGPDKKGRSLETFVSEIKFFFHNWTVVDKVKSTPKWKNLKFIQERESGHTPSLYLIKKGTWLYLEQTDSDSKLVSKHKSDVRSFINVIHPQYIQDICHNEDQVRWFQNWLHKSCGLNVRPRLTYGSRNYNGPGSTHFLTEEGKFLVENDPVGFLIECCNHWSYRSQIDGGVSTFLEKKLTTLLFPCTDGVNRVLSGTVWEASKNNELKQILSLLDYLQLPDGPDWKSFLPRFGVITGPGSHALLVQLRRLSDSSPRSKNALREYDCGMIYTWMGKLRPEVLEQRKAQMSFPWVYDSKSGHWNQLDECVWQSLFALKQKPVLREIYPTCGELFQKQLKVRDACIEDFVEEGISVVGQMPGMNDAERSMAFLKKISHLMVAGDKSLEPKVLIAQKVFPLSIRDSVGEEDQLKTINLASGLDSWYIPDKAELRERFRGQIHMLASTEEETAELMPLIECLGFADRLLSNAVNAKPYTTGQKYLDKVRTWEVRQKRLNLLYVLDKEKDDVVEEIRRCAVYVLDKQEIVHYVNDTEVEREFESVRHEWETNTQPTQPMEIFISKNADNFKVAKLLGDRFCSRLGIEDEKIRDMAIAIHRAPLKDFISIVDQYNIEINDKEKIDISEYVEKPVEVEDDTREEFLRMASIVFESVPVTTTGESGIVGAFGVASLAAPQGVVPQGVVPQGVAPQWESPNDILGREGEKYVNDLFGEFFSDWNPEEHWTSDLRKRYGFSGFEEKNFADFTFADSEGRMAKFLGLWTPDARSLQKYAGKTVRYHIELKSTIHGEHESFEMSAGQVVMARKYRLRPQDAYPKDVFVLMRLYDFRSERKGIKCCIDPWNNDKMVFGFPEKVGGKIV
ncbi:putative Protein NO VEIN C-terminal domain-containing protein [Seiridium cardinale]